MEYSLDRDSIQIPLRILLTFAWNQTEADGWTHEAWERFAARQQDALKRVGHHPGAWSRYVVSDRLVADASFDEEAAPLLVLSLFVVNTLSDEEEDDSQAVDEAFLADEPLDEDEAYPEDDPEREALYRRKFEETVEIVQEVMGTAPDFRGHCDQEDYPPEEWWTMALAYWNTPRVNLRIELLHEEPGSPYLIMIFLTPP